MAAARWEDEEKKVGWDGEMCSSSLPAVTGWLGWEGGKTTELVTGESAVGHHVLWQTYPEKCQSLSRNKV